MNCKQGRGGFRPWRSEQMDKLSIVFHTTVKCRLILNCSISCFLLINLLLVSVTKGSRLWALAPGSHQIMRWVPLIISALCPFEPRADLCLLFCIFMFYIFKFWYFPITFENTKVSNPFHSLRHHLSFCWNVTFKINHGIFCFHSQAPCY